MSRLKYIEDLVCPIGKYPLKESGEMLECSNCGAKYPVREGIPLMLVDDAILPDGVKDMNELKCFKEKSIA
ncbi:MAG: Trm112 family protein [Ignavibacteria bacterium]